MRIDASNDFSSVSRRKVLSWTMLGTMSGVASLSGCTAPQEDPSVKPTSKATETPTPVPVPQSTLKDRDPRVVATLEEGTQTAGIARTFPGAFPSVKVKSIEPLRGLGTAPYPLLAVSIAGRKNQLQILDPRSKSVKHTIQIKESQNGGIETMVWDVEHKVLYFGTKAIIYSWDPTHPNTVSKLGVVQGATTIYELNLDSHGNVWGGTYPSGCVFKYTPDQKKITVYKRLAPDADYVRRVAISSNDVVWAGTGSVNPKVYTFPASDPTAITEIQLPTEVPEGFITSLTALGSRVAVTASDTKEQLLIDPVTKAWSGRVNREWDERVASALAGDSTITYTVTNKQLVGINTTDWSEDVINTITTDKPLSIMSYRDHVVLMGRSSRGLRFEILDISTRQTLTAIDVPVNPGELTIQSALGHSDGNIYLGGYMGDSVVALNPSSGHSWQSPHQVSDIHQVEGMIEFNPSRTYLGSYDGADLINMDTTNRTDPIAYNRFERLGTIYRQSRPFGWAKNSTNVFFGTVPSYGRSGGAIGMISPIDNKVVWVLDGNGKGFVKGHSIVSLAATDDHLYGTTSVRNGYGVPDTGGDAVVFKFDLHKKKVVWKSRPISGAGALYAANLVSGWLLVSDVEGIAIIDIRNGKLVRRHTLTEAKNSAHRAGWTDASVALLGGGDRLVHIAAGKATLVDFLRGKRHDIGDKTNSNFGTRVVSAANGKAYATKDLSTLVELDLTLTTKH